MSKPHPIQDHFRKTFLAGIFAVVPVAGTVFLFWWINDKTSVISEWMFGRRIVFLGVLVTLLAVYLVGLIATSLLGKFCLRLIDKALTRIPGLKELYTAWKQISLNQEGTEGTFSKVVLIPDECGAHRMLGFCGGKSVDGDADHYCVFVPNAPNPINGRLYFVDRARCQFLDVSAEDAFKLILSTGNYVPSGVGMATARVKAPTIAALAGTDLK